MTRSFAQCREEIIGTGWLGNLERASLSAAEAKFEPAADDASPFGCGECPDDPRPHLHCPWGGLHKHYADEETDEPGCAEHGC